MRQFPLALFLASAVFAVSLSAETVGQDEPSLFNPYREPARPLSPESQWGGRIQPSSNITTLPPVHSGPTYSPTVKPLPPYSPAQLGANQETDQRRNVLPSQPWSSHSPTPIYNGAATNSRSPWTANRQYEQRLAAMNNDTRFYQKERQQKERQQKQRQAATRPDLDFQVRSLFMTKDNSPTQSLAQSSQGTITTRDADLDGISGLEATFFKALPDQTRAELVYWGLFTEGDSAGQQGVLSGIQTTLDISGLNYGSVGDPLSDQFNGVTDASLRRGFEYHNLELNWGGTARGEQVTLQYLAGFRYFKASENLALQMGDVSLVGKDDNHLFGFQVGTHFAWQPKERIEFHSGVKFGIFANSIDHQLRIQGPAGFAYAGTVASPQPLNQNLDTSTVATLGQLDLGFTYHVNERLRLTSGYRIVSVTGLSLPVNQLSQSLAEQTGSPSLHSDGSILLHGAYVGLKYDF